MIETPASGGQPPAQTLKTQYSSPLLSLGSVSPQVLMAKNTPQFKPRMVAQPRGPLFRPTCTRTVNTSTVKDSSFQGVPILYVQFLMNFWLCAEITFSHCKSIGNNCSLGTVQTCGPVGLGGQPGTETDETQRPTGLGDELDSRTD